MRNLLTLLILLLLSPLSSQSDIQPWRSTPDSYAVDVWRDAVNKHQRLLQDWDYVIPPSESIPVRPNVQTLADGNWGFTWLGIDQHYDAIKKAGKRKVAVFIIDTASRLDHPFLKDFAWNDLGASFTGETPKGDGNGHGTHVAGIIGAKNGSQPLGICRPLIDKGLIKGIPVAALNSEGSGSHSWVAKAIDYSVSKADSLQAEDWFCIISMSLGSNSYSSIIDKALDKAEDKGIFIVCASGNTYNKGVNYPAKLLNNQAIGSIDDNGARSEFSTYGDELWMVSPGRSIMSTYKDGRLAKLSGTSMATPHQAGLVAIAASVHPRATADQLEFMLSKTATDLGVAGWDQETGHGYNFVKQIINYENPDVEPDPEPEPDTLEVNLLVNRRMVETILPGPYPILYQSGEGKFKTLLVSNIAIKTRSKVISDNLLQDLAAKVDTFFTSRAMTLRAKEDALLAGYWSNRFLEIHFKRRYSEKIYVTYSILTDENNNHGSPVKPPLFDFLTKSKRSTFTY